MTDYSKAVFASPYRYERLELKGSEPFSVTVSSLTTLTIPHNLGYKPFFKAYYTYGGKIFRLFAGTASFDLDGNGGQIDNANMTTTDLVVQIFNFGVSDISGTLYYRIYAEPQR